MFTLKENHFAQWLHAFILKAASFVFFTAVTHSNLTSLYYLFHPQSGVTGSQPARTASVTQTNVSNPVVHFSVVVARTKGSEVCAKCYVIFCVCNHRRY